jgi:hypothetical protein
MCDELVRSEANLEFMVSPIQIALKLGHKSIFQNLGKEPYIHA